jgi:hypothetical protein
MRVFDRISYVDCYFYRDKCYIHRLASMTGQVRYDDANLSLSFSDLRHPRRESNREIELFPVSAHTMPKGQIPADTTFTHQCDSAIR